MSTTTTTTTTTRTEAPTTARELFGDVYVNGPIRVDATTTTRLDDDDDVVVETKHRRHQWRKHTRYVYGPFTNWDCEELGKTLAVHVFDGILNVDAREIATIAMDEREKSGGVGISVSNVGGYHSTPNAFERRREDGMRALRELMERACARVCEENAPLSKFMIKNLMGRGDPSVVTTSWVNVCEASNGHGLHNHVNAVWSGVYYASTGKDEDDDDEGSDGEDAPGDLLIRVTAGGIDPMVDKSGYCKYARVKPKNGRLVVFPSWVLHGVLASSAPSPRVSIAFNTGETNVSF